MGPLQQTQTIFIGIAAYCDPLLKSTILDALRKAKHPERLYFGVVEQNKLEDCLTIESFEVPQQIRYFNIDPIQSRGVCWARALTMSLYQGENWFLQIDSHMLFEQDWDLTFIQYAQGCSIKNPHFVISSYPNPFVIENGELIPKPITDKVISHVVAGNSEFSNDSLILKFSGIVTPSDTPILGFHIGAGCLFAPGKFVEHFPYDPQLYFHGEEQSLAARLFTRGWDIFHIPRMPIYHLYETVNAPTRQKHWDESHNRTRTHNYALLLKQAEYRLKNILLGQGDLGIYGLGSVRTMAQYADFFGVDYEKRTIAPFARKGPWVSKRKIKGINSLLDLLYKDQLQKPLKKSKGQEIVIVCPPLLPMVESNALYLLAKELNQAGVKAQLFFMDINAELSSSKTHFKLKNQNTSEGVTPSDISVIDRIRRSSQILIIFPEIYTKLIEKFPDNPKAIWWLSVENAFPWNKSLSEQTNLDNLLHHSELLHLSSNESTKLFLKKNQVKNSLPLFITNEISTPTITSPSPILGFNIIELNPYHPRPYVFSEVALCLRDSILQAGYACSVHHNQVGPYEWSIVLGANVDSSILWALDHQHTILFNFEQLESNSSLITEEYIELLRSYPVFDYHLNNIRFLSKKSVSGDHKGHFEMPIVPSISPFVNHESSSPKDIDVLFFGTPSPRREKVIQQLQKCGLVVKTIAGAYAHELTPTIRRAKLVLHIHFYDTALVTPLRFIQPIAQGLPIVSEKSVQTELSNWQKSGVYFAPYDELVDQCLKVLADPLHQQISQQKNVAFIQTLPFAKAFQSALEHLNISISSSNQDS